jgi:TRAP-type C4-dicarboxylate transport system permease small subunit
MKGNEPFGSMTMNTIIKFLEKAGVTVAGVCLIAIMLLVSADAIARYAMNSPIPWTMDVVSYYLMVTVAYLAAADTFRHGDHIRLDLFQAHMGPRTKAWTGVLCATLTAMVFSIVAYGSAHNMIEAFLAEEYMPGYIAWPIWLSYLPIVLGAGLLAIRLVHHSVMLLSRGEDPAIELQEEI